jgi:hypothetical protein
MRISSVVAYWNRKHEVIGSHSDQANLFLLHAATILLFYSIQTITLPMFFFPKIETIHHFMAQM